MKGTILIVDDERKITEVLAAYLTRTGYQVEVAYDGGKVRYQLLC